MLPTPEALRCDGATVAVIGGGPAGLMAAEVLAQGGARVAVYDAMPSVGRKFLMAGVGGLNITHAEPAPRFVARYGPREREVGTLLARFDAGQLRDWIHGLGIDTFVGSSGRVFPAEMKAAPLLRAWLHRLRGSGVSFHVRHRWQGWTPDGDLRFLRPTGALTTRPDATVLALGGGSWSRLGSDGAWVPLLAARGAEVAPLRPANCGFEADWTPHFVERFAGQPVKNIVARCTGPDGVTHERPGELVITAYGVEGGLVYALSAALRDAIEAWGSVRLELDLLPGRSADLLAEQIARPRGSRSMGSHLQSRVGLAGVRAGLLRECVPRATYDDPAALAAAIKALPVTLVAPRPLDEAISTAGGLCFEALDARLMLHAVPGVFCAGEMLDWEAPTGGYLLTACFASGRAAGLGALEWLATR